jgi:cadmium resistance transport/sequestration family protein
MTWVWTTIMTAVATFAATNFDDIVILMLFFSQTTPTFRRRHIVLGQYLGFATLVAVSLVGFFSSLLIPQPWIGLLGLAPIIIGVRKFLQRADDTPPAMGRPIVEAPARTSGLLQQHTFSVAAVTIANGGDNIGIYVPLFASSTSAGVVVILVVFCVLVAVWCYLGYQFTRQPVVAQVLARYGHVLVPLVLIGLGVYIVIESNTLTLLRG